MAADATLDALAPFLAETLAETPGAGVRLTHAIAAQLGAGTHHATEPLADRLHHLAQGLRHIARPAAADATLKVMLALADAVREVIEDSRSTDSGLRDAARLPQTALDLLALGARDQLTQARTTIAALGDDTAGHVARLRFYASLGLDEIADLLGVSTATARRAWNQVRTRLRS